MDVFFVGRFAHGVANAFTAPVLLALLYESTDRATVARPLARFAGMQTAGLAFAPLACGLGATVEWRFVFAVMAAAALVFYFMSYSGRDQVSERRTVPTSVREKRLALPCGLIFLVYSLVIGAMTLGALVAADRLDMAPLERGSVLATLGLAALLSMSSVGRLARRVEIRRFGAAGLLIAGAATLMIYHATTLVLLMLGLWLCGVACVLGRVTVSSLVVRIAGENVASAGSVVQAWQFLGGALAPSVATFIYLREGSAWLLLPPTVLVAMTILLVWPVRLLVAAPAADHSRAAVVKQAA
jgi:predicted MFS family arabinose efflux permease